MATNNIYHVVKASRSYTGNPYQGPSSLGKPASAETIGDAKQLAAWLLDRNPVGWAVYNSETKELVWLVDEL